MYVCTEAQYALRHFNTTAHPHILQEGILFAMTVLLQEPLTPFPGSVASETRKLSQPQNPHLQN